jgi:hypothetical protein
MPVPECFPKPTRVHRLSTFFLNKSYEMRIKEELMSADVVVQ